MQRRFKEIERSLPAAILLDLHLPKIDGLEFLRRLRAHADIPTAVITGDYLVDDHIVDDLDTLGIRIFFKPLWEEDLIQIVGMLVGSRSGANARAIQ